MPLFLKHGNIKSYINNDNKIHNCKNTNVANISWACMWIDLSHMTLLKLFRCEELICIFLDCFKLTKEVEIIWSLYCRHLQEMPLNLEMMTRYSMLLSSLTKKIKTQRNLQRMRSSMPALQFTNLLLKPSEFYFCLYLHDLVCPLFNIRPQFTLLSSVSTDIKSQSLHSSSKTSFQLQNTYVDHMFSVYRSTPGQENDLSVIYSSIKRST